MALQSQSHRPSRKCAGEGDAKKEGGVEGEGESKVKNDVFCIWCIPLPDDSRGKTFRLRNCQWAAAKRCHLFPDAIVVVGGVEFPVHRSIMSAHSMFFERLFSSCMQEGASQLDLHSLHSSLLFARGALL